MGYSGVKIDSDVGLGAYNFECLADEFGVRPAIRYAPRNTLDPRAPKALKLTHGSRFMVEGIGFRVQGVGFRVWFGVKGAGGYTM